MTPYPNLGALVEGQNIKHHDKMLYEDLGISNLHFYESVQKVANWLTGQGLKPKQRVRIYPQEFPLTEMLLFGIWTVGASVVLTEDIELKLDGDFQPDMVLNKKYSIDFFRNQPEHYSPIYKPSLEDEALVFVRANKCIRLSHYNLLVNANDIQRKLDLYEDGTFFIQLNPDSTAWVVLQAIFPLYTGAPLTNNNPDLTIGIHDEDYIVDFNWARIEKSNRLYILPENTAVLSIGNDRLQMTRYQLNSHQISLNGHSVMMGYIDEKMNEKVFKNGSLNLLLNR